MNGCDPASFRLAAFQVDWVDRLADPQQEALSAALLEEAQRWIEEGLRIGYFATDGSAAATVDTATTFADALADAQDDLTTSRRRYLQLVCFAEQDEWERELGALADYTQTLAAAGDDEELPTLPETLSWALTGAASELGVDPAAPAHWRSPAGLNADPLGRLAALEAERDLIRELVLSRAEQRQLVIVSEGKGEVRATPTPSGDVLAALADLNRGYMRFFNRPAAETVERVEAANRLAIVEVEASFDKRVPFFGNVALLSIRLGDEVRVTSRYRYLAGVGFTPRELEELDRNVKQGWEHVRYEYVTTKEAATPPDAGYLASVLDQTLERTIDAFATSIKAPRRLKRIVRNAAQWDARRHLMRVALQAAIGPSEFGAALDAAMRLAWDDPRRRLLTQAELEALDAAAKRYGWDPWAVDALLGKAIARLAVARSGGSLTTVEAWLRLAETQTRRQYTEYW